MKSTKTAIMFFVMTSLLSVGAFAGKSGGGGGGEGNGGDGCLAEFVAIGRNLARMLPELDVTAVDQKAFYNTIDETTVRVTHEALYADGQRVQAVNFPAKKLVVVNKSLCDTLATPATAKVMIVFHEYLGIMGLEKSGDYRISSTIAELLKNGKLELAVSMPRPGTENGLCFPVSTLVSGDRFDLSDDDVSMLNHFRHAAYIRNVSDGLDYDYVFTGGTLDDCRMAVEVARKKPRQGIIKGIMTAARSGDSSASPAVQMLPVNVVYRKGLLNGLVWFTFMYPYVRPFTGALAFASYIGNTQTVKTLAESGWYDKNSSYFYAPTANPLYVAVSRAIIAHIKTGSSGDFGRHVSNAVQLVHAGYDTKSITGLIEQDNNQFCGEQSFWDLFTSQENPLSAARMARYAHGCGVCTANGYPYRKHFASMLARMPPGNSASALDLIWTENADETQKDCIKGLGYRPGIHSIFTVMAPSLGDPASQNKYETFRQTVLNAYAGGFFNTAIPGSQHMAGDIKSPSPMMYALHKGDNWLLGRMLSGKTGGLDTRFKGKWYYTMTLLDYALFRNNLEAAKMLVDAGAGFEENESTPLLAHLLDNSASVEAIRFAVAHGLKINQELYNNVSWLYRAIYVGRADVALLLLDLGALPDRGDSHYNNRPGKTPLHLAVINNMRDVVSGLAAKGANLNALDQYGEDEGNSDEGNNRTPLSYTPLMYAAIAGNMAMAKLLVRLGADPGVLHKGRTSHWSSYSERWKVYPYAETAGDIARNAGHKKLARFLKRAEGRR